MSEIHEKEFAIIINAYRKSLTLRYSKENVVRFKEFETVERAIIDKLVFYFLELLYPEHETRLELDNAFQSLAGFVHSPQKFFGIIGNIPYAVYNFGRQFISALHAGASALRSYVTAHRFENELFKHGKQMMAQGIDIMDDKNFMILISKIPKKEADEFRIQIIHLFEILAKKELLAKIVLVMEHVIEKMTQRKDIYTDLEIKGISMGLEIIKKGKSIFDELNEEQVKIILKGIDTIEDDFFARAMQSQFGSAH